MKVNILTVESYPAGNAGANRVHNLALGFSRKSIKTTVYILGAVGNKKSSNASNYEGVDFRYLLERKDITSKKGYKSLFKLQILLESLRLLCKDNSEDTLNIIVGGGTFDLRNIIVLASFFLRSKVYLETNEYPFVNEPEGCFLQLKRFVFYKMTLPFYDGHLVISSALYEHIQGKIGQNKPIIKVPILSREKSIGHKVISKSPVNSPYMIYAGSFLDKKDGFLDVLRAFKICSKKYPKMVFVMAGNYLGSPDRNTIDEIIENGNIKDRVLFTGYLGREELSRYYLYANLAVVNKPLTKQNIYGFNTKIAEYIEHGVPLVLSRVGENIKYFTHGDNALLIEPGDVEAIEASIMELMAKPKLSEHLVRSASILANEHFNVNPYVSKILNSIT